MLHFGLLTKDFIDPGVFRNGSIRNRELSNENIRVNIAGIHPFEMAIFKVDSRGLNRFGWNCSWTCFLMDCFCDRVNKCIRFEIHLIFFE